MSTSTVFASSRAVLLTLIVALFSVALQGVVLRTFVPGTPVPNLAVILVVFLAFYDPSTRGVCTCFLIGLLLDFSSAGLIGPFAASFVVVFGFLSAMSQRMFVESGLTTFMAVAFGAFLSRIVYAAVVFEFRPRESLFGGSFWNLLGECLLSAVLAPFVFKLFRSILLDYRRRAE